MKMIIDIPNMDKEKIVNYFGCCTSRLENTIQNSIILPDNATNGDMIKALFSETAEITGEFGVFFEDRWWNAPYKRGETE